MNTQCDNNCKQQYIQQSITKHFHASCARGGLFFAIIERRFTSVADSLQANDVPAVLRQAKDQWFSHAAISFFSNNEM
ncbi:hypothetical protein EFER_3125 [Escherichia fergusonii ATCC 35469]|uniref:Uncharacterized protein n=1 Tax=Escherichia fergusonii (strain ATCC 35469 / DSM 13698 / CCUG 18766 / IAM 14443 / JCM 21226 / LMG 7866 / NBRC 102419 / NCTC 12128 / CDC 0568-73) TaxID=585054 RepID=B7LR15_ESCF3|nr:hypothetical protein EFER_3125 [Escherichia fergusonii ATCC 35469]